jgi:hypothetical protein
MTDTLNVTGEFAPAEIIAIAAQDVVSTEGVHIAEIETSSGQISRKRIVIKH